ncbi:hypothetical protein [Nitriliruptor alkaliphilus]|uniref:hypothetical protein n=1 Tax=Nitriliruptor alkaliphilus TaxID=427918 RepID=UPI000698D804|nr:hypothetical protein [Nitriliruptor alkaliphilus]
MSFSSRSAVIAGPRVHRAVSRPRRWGGVWSSVAAERHGDYAADDADHVTGSPDPSPSCHTVATARDGAPFGLPVLAEVPRLASVLRRLEVADEAMLAAVAELADLLASDEVERVTGVGIDHWLAAVAAQTRMDRRLLVRTCRLLHRLPTLDRAVRTGRLSFPQLRGVALALRSAPTAIDDELDAFLGSLLDELERLEHPDPDVLVRQLGDAVDELAPDDLAERERDATAGRYLTIEPFLDGTGGRFHGAFDAAGLALLEAASTPPAALEDHPDGYGAARADTLLARLASDQAPAADPDQAGSDGAAAASRAVVAPGSADVPWWDRLAPPTVLLRLPFATLLDDRVPADLLTTLVGAGYGSPPLPRVACSTAAAPGFVRWWSTMTGPCSGSAGRPGSRPGGCATCWPRCTTPAPARAVTALHAGPRSTTRPRGGRPVPTDSQGPPTSTTSACSVRPRTASRKPRGGASPRAPRVPAPGTTREAA